MKKLFITAAIFMCLGTAAIAQQKAVATKPAAKMEVVKKTSTTAKVIPVTKMTTGTPAVKAMPATKTTVAIKAIPAVPLKADGTPDKRYKTKTVTGPLKKDGTADMRYKANKVKKGN
ncbi:MAG: hypothetical protein ABJA37_06755 [Ferruginibacter sp.]